MKKPKKASLGDQRDFLIGGSRKVIFSAKETDGDIYLVEGIMPAGSEVPVHVHELEDEIFHVLEGKVELRLGEESFGGEEGDIIYLPRGVKHGIKTIGSSKARVLNYVIPGKNFEDFFEKLNELGSSASDDEKSDLAAVHKIKFL
ncbi:MAG: cupin domain-containing protein [Bacteroidota bacterium]